MIPIKYNIRSVVVRRMGTAMTVFGVALTVAVFVSILAMVRGLQSTYVDTGNPLNLILIRRGSQTETNSFFDRDVKKIVETMDGVEAAAGEIVVIINHPRVTGETSNVMIRGISENSMALRPGIQLVEGQMFKPGLREMVVSRSISERFKDTGLGESIRIGRSDWKVVGIFDAARTAYDSEIWADYNEVAQEFERPIYSSILLRTSGEDATADLQKRIADDRRLKLDAVGEREYFEKQTSTGDAIKILAYFVAVIMAIGSCFAVMNTMYAATSRRTREIATLRVLGFRRWSILVSFVLESIVLGIVGGIVGCLLALPVHGISTGTTNFTSFSEVVFQFRITPELMAEGILFAAIMGGIGGLLPARLASRVPIVRALRSDG
ncbi:MAG TPA: ABC transporter permease [Terriglobia bacterium]|nr:ABC transporter permease [Terriglobia bacterium]